MNEELVKYFAGEMSSSEKEGFEKIINSTPHLQKEVAKYRDFFSAINMTSNPEVEESYFTNLVPKLRERVERGKKKKYHPEFSFATAVLTVIVILLFMPRSNQVVKDENFVLNYSTSEISDYLTLNSVQPLLSNLPAEYESNYDSLLDGMIYDELSNYDQNLADAELIDRLDYNTLIQSVNPNDASIIYEQLKNKKIF